MSFLVLNDSDLAQDVLRGLFQDYSADLPLIEQNMLVIDAP